MRRIIFLLMTVAIASNVMAQSVGELDEYRRNSISTMMVYHSEDEFGENIYEAFQSIPMPDKYDDHNVGWNVIFNDSLVGAKRYSNGLIKAQYGERLNKQEVEINAKVLERTLNDAQ